MTASKALALAGLTGLWIAVAYQTAFVADLELARPESVAAAATTSQLGFFAILALAWPWAVNVSRAAIEAANRWSERLRTRRRLAILVWGLLGLGGLAAVGLLIRFFVSIRSDLAALPVGDAVELLAVGVGWAVTAQLSRAPPIRRASSDMDRRGDGRMRAGRRGCRGHAPAARSDDRAGRGVRARAQRPHRVRRVDVRIRLRSRRSAQRARRGRLRAVRPEALHRRRRDPGQRD